jgi:hypothetical protein
MATVLFKYVAATAQATGNSNMRPKPPARSILGEKARKSMIVFGRMGGDRGRDRRQGQGQEAGTGLI